MIDLVMGLIGTLLYPLFSIVFVAIDGIQAIFFAFAGIGEISFNASGSTLTGSTQIGTGNTGKETDTGILYYLMNHSIIRNLIISIAVLGLFLIIVFTVMAFIKNAYAAKQKGWKEIIGNALKGLANFIFLPICCLLGVWLGNILLQAINGATSAGGATSMSRKLFIAAAYNANIYRNANGNVDEAKENIEAFLKVYDMEDKFTVKDNESAAYYADLIDQIYSYGGRTGSWFTAGVPLYSHTSVGPGITPGAGYYNLAQINYIVIIVGGIFMLYALGSLTFAMVRRIFILLTLFVISPGVCAMYPLDEGKAVGSWAGEVKKSILSAYGAVAGMNIFYSILPLIDNIHLGGNDFGAAMSSVFISDLLQLFIMVSGLLVVKEIIGLISGFVGGEDAYSKGSSLMKSTAGAMKKYGGGAVKKTSAFVGRIKGGMAAGQTFKQSFFGEVKRAGKVATAAVTGGIVDIDGTKKAYKDARKEAKEKAWEGHDSRGEFARQIDDKNYKQLLENNKGQQIDLQQIYNFLNSVKDEAAKKKYEEGLIAHNTRNAMFSANYQDTGRTDRKGNPIYEKKSEIARGGVSLVKEGSYIENAKTYKEHQKAMEVQHAEVKLQEAEFKDAKVNLEKLGGWDMFKSRSTSKDYTDEMSEKIANGFFAAKTAKGNVHQALQQDKLQGRLATKTEFSSEEISKASKDVAAQMIKFNQHLQGVAALESTEKTLDATFKSLVKTVNDATEKLKIKAPKVDFEEMKHSIQSGTKTIDELFKDLKKLKDLINYSK